MIIFPAIDLKDGLCVRLVRGEMESATVFNDDPAAQAKTFADAGFEWLHCVDLNGAFAGRSMNADTVKSIRAAVKIPIQLGGGIRDHAGIEHWLEAGIARVVLGTAALRNPPLVREAATAHPGRIAVGIDARDGLVAVEGWLQTSKISAHDLARRFEDSGVAAIVFTDIGRDGAGTGVNVEATAALASAVGIPVIASGGVSSLNDLERLGPIHRLYGVVVGRALYDGRLSAADALAWSRQANQLNRKQ